MDSNCEKISMLLTLAAAATLWVSVPCSADVYKEYEDPAFWRSCYRSNTNVESRRSDHFVFRFGDIRKQGFLSEQLFHGQLQFLEHVYDTWRMLGLKPLGGYDLTTKYKGIIEPGVSFLGDTEGTAVGFSEPPASLPYLPGIHCPAGTLDYRNPNGCTPHEFGHGWQNHYKGGLPACQPQGFTESLANWMMQQHLVSYPQDWISVGMPMAHAAVGYNCMTIFNHFMYAPGYGSNFINALICSTNVGADLPDQQRYYADDMVRKAMRVDTSVAIDKARAIHDQLGIMNARMLNMDLWNRPFNTAYSYLQDTNRAGYHLYRIPMVRQQGVDGAWYRPEWTCTPQTLMNSFIPLTITATGSSRIVTCDFRPVADALRGSMFRICFVAYNANGDAHYGRVWNAGENTFTLAADDRAVYLAVTACPNVFNASITWNDYTLNNVAMFPYRIRLEGASPRGWRWPAPTAGFSRHPNGGGIKADTATVDASAFIGTNAMVLGTAKVYGRARIEDFARVDSNAVIGRSGQRDNPVVSRHAYVTGDAQVYGHAKIRDYAWVWGTSKVYDSAVVMAHTMLENATIHGSAVMNQAPLRDPGLCHKGDISGCAIIGGDTSGTIGRDKGVWCEFPAISVDDNKYQYLGYNFEKTNCVFAMDQYGMNHSFLMNFPKIAGSTIAGIGTKVLELDGVNQYVEVRPDAVDFADMTLTMWVNWRGAAADQKIFSFGDGAAKSMWLTPKDAASGVLRFTISTGVASQALSGTASLAPDTWTYVAISFSGSTGTLYVSGKPVRVNPSMTIDPDQINAPLMQNANFIGRDTAGNYFKGLIDEFRVYNKALMATEIAAVAKDITPGLAPAPDTAPPSPSPTWLMPPVVIGAHAIAMSATVGSDPNGVYYYFTCVNDRSHDSGWLSENTYTDCKAVPGVTYSYTVKMKDVCGNASAESTPKSVIAPAADTTPPTPNPPTFSIAPRGLSTTSITMTATAGSDAGDLVMYKFSRNGSAVSSGWTTHHIWTDTGLAPGTSGTYTLQMRDEHGNTTSIATSSPAVARDDAPPALDADVRFQWDLYPYAQVNKAVRMYARPQREMEGIQFYYECVELPGINSGWISNALYPSRTPEWITPPLTNGTYRFRFRMRDTSPQANMSEWSSAKRATVSSFNSYGTYSLEQLAALPDDTLVMFTGKVIEVRKTQYVVNNGKASINVTPRTYLSRTDATLLGRNVMVKGHLWTYAGTPKRVTYAYVQGDPQTGKIELENCDNNELPRLLFDSSASGSELLGWYQEGRQGEPWAVMIGKVAATDDVTIGYKKGGGILSLYTNGAHAANLMLPFSATYTTMTQTGLVIAAGTTLMIKKDPGDTEPDLDYVIIGGTYSISGRVTDSNGKAIAGAGVYFKQTPNAVQEPCYITTTDATGNYTQTVTPGTWYMAAGAPVQRYLTSADRKVAVSSAHVHGVNVALAPLKTSFIRTKDLLLSCVPEMLPDNGVVDRWLACYPTGLVLQTLGSPSVEVVGGQKWEKNSQDSYDGFVWRDVPNPIAVNGVTIIVSARPVRHSVAQPWQAIVNIFHEKVSLGVRGSTGVVHVKRQRESRDSTAVLPDGVPVVLSMVVQPDGSYKVYTNSVEIMSVTNTCDMTSIVPAYKDGDSPRPGWPHIGIGRTEPDGFSAHNGGIGDVAIYKVALSDAERLQIEKLFMRRCQMNHQREQ